MEIALALEAAVAVAVAVAVATRRIGIGGRAPSGVAQKQKPFAVGCMGLLL